MLITVLTPTYNREYTLKRLYNSLETQTCKNFCWFIVDDGSSDNTKSLVEEIKKNSSIPINYIFKENGGKHTALNKGIRNITTELTFIVDSDDILTNDAISSIYDTWDEIRDKNLCGISFLKGYNEEKIIGDAFPKDKCIDNFINIRSNKNIKGDKAEIWRTNLLQQTPWPEFENEKFMAMGYVWNTIAKNYNMLFVNKIIYIADYLEGGLTKSGKKIRIESPVGGMANAKLFFSNEFNLKSKVKKMWLYICYGFFANKSIKFMFSDCGARLLFIMNLPFGYMLYKFWKNKYYI